MKKLLSTVMVLTIALALVACGGGESNSLSGEWSGTDSNGTAITINFKNDGSLTFDNEFFSESAGTYEITEGADATSGTVDLEIELWDMVKAYDFVIDGDSLMLTATDGMSVDFDLAK